MLQMARVPTAGKPVQYLPLKVVAVLRTMDEAKHEGVQGVKKFCSEERVMFETRLYDSSKFRHDRDEIEKLPAFHIYIKDRYEKTFYPEGRPYQIIDDHIILYLERQRIKWENKNKWKSFWKHLKVTLKSLGRRETRLEKAERERYTQAQQRAQQRTGRRFSMIDWS